MKERNSFFQFVSMNYLMYGLRNISLDNSILFLNLLSGNIAVHVALWVQATRWVWFHSICSIIVVITIVIPTFPTEFVSLLVCKVFCLFFGFFWSCLGTIILIPTSLVPRMVGGNVSIKKLSEIILLIIWIRAFK